MNTSPTIALVSEALAEAQGRFAAVEKDGLNPHYGNHYATLAAHVEAVRSHLSALGLAVLQEVTSFESTEGISITTRIVHSSGEWIEFGPFFVPCSRYDAQGLGSAITYGRRYTFAAAVGTVPESDEDDDGNAAVERTPARPAKAAYAPPQTVVNTATGQVVPVAEAPPAPDGYYYVANYKLSANGWHEAHLLAYDERGGSLKVSTKTKTGEALKAAQEAGVPVKVKLADRGKPGEAFLNDCVLYAGLKKTAPAAPPAEPFDSDSIPF